MENHHDVRKQPSFRRDSPSPSASPPQAIRTSRSVSAESTGSISPKSSSMGRESLGSNASSADTSTSRSSSASYETRRYTNRQSTGGLEKTTRSRSKGRRGYVRPEGTTFAASAQSRDSVLSLGSIAHLQYYFARTGLLDGKGGRLMKKRLDNRGTLDLSGLDVSFLLLRGSDADSSYASMGDSPELNAQGHRGLMVESPTNEDDEYFSDEEDDDNHAHMLPPTASTYHSRVKSIPHPPTLQELKSGIEKGLTNAAKVLEEAKQNPKSPPVSPARAEHSEGGLNSPAISESSDGGNQGWYELQGMHILDIMTLAIRAARRYYTAHDQPARLSAIRSERKIRAELLSVMEVLKRMASRNFTDGMRSEERITMENWVASVWDMLQQEEVMEEAERKQRASWSWLDDSWEGGSIDREYAFMKSMDLNSATLPEFTSVDEMTDDEPLTPFLKDLKTGQRLVELHNAVIRKSKRSFGAIGKWHTDFGKPYRSAENLRYWIKAAELRWEVVLKVDVMGVVNGSDRAALKGFEDAIWKWCAVVREEIAAELRV